MLKFTSMFKTCHTRSRTPEQLARCRSATSVGQTHIITKLFDIRVSIGRPAVFSSGFRLRISSINYRGVCFAQAKLSGTRRHAVIEIRSVIYHKVLQEKMCVEHFGKVRKLKDGGCVWV